MRALQPRNGCFSSTAKSLTCQNFYAVFILSFNHFLLLYASKWSYLNSPSILGIFHLAPLKACVFYMSDWQLGGWLFHVSLLWSVFTHINSTLHCKVMLGSLSSLLFRNRTQIRGIGMMYTVGAWGIVGRACSESVANGLFHIHIAGCYLSCCKVEYGLEHV